MLQKGFMSQDFLQGIWHSKNINLLDKNASEP